MAVLRVMLIAMVGMASACTTRSRNGQVAPIESGQVDIPIRLQFQQGPIPSASFSVGIDSKMNQNVGNGVYKQTQFNGGFEVQGAAVPVIDADRKITGLTADIDTHVSHDNKVVYFDHNPNIPTAKPSDPFTARPVASVDQPIVVQQADQQSNFAVAAAAAAQPNKKPLREKDGEASAQQSNIAGLKQEYFIAIMCVSGACFIVLVVVMLIVAKKKQAVVEQVDCNNHHRRHHHHAPTSVYSGPIYAPEVVVDQKPPSYHSENFKSETRSNSSDFEKKF